MTPAAFTARGDERYNTMAKSTHPLLYIAHNDTTLHKRLQMYVMHLDRITCCPIRWTVATKENQACVPYCINTIPSRGLTQPKRPAISSFCCAWRSESVKALTCRTSVMSGPKPLPLTAEEGHGMRLQSHVSPDSGTNRPGLRAADWSACAGWHYGCRCTVAR